MKTELIIIATAVLLLSSCAAERKSISRDTTAYGAAMKDVGPQKKKMPAWYLTDKKSYAYEKVVDKKKGIVTRYYLLNYVDVEAVYGNVLAAVSPGARVEMDKKYNAFLITDKREKFEDIENIFIGND